MKRSGPPQRRTELARGEGPTRKTPLKRGSGPKRRNKSTPQHIRDAQKHFFKRTMELCGGQCAVTGITFRERELDDPLRLTAHHVVEKAWLKAHGLEHLLWDPENGLAVTNQVHDNHHHAAGKRIPRWKLSARNLAFAEAVGAMTEIERKYPE